MFCEIVIRRHRSPTGGNMKHPYLFALLAGGLLITGTAISAEKDPRDLSNPKTKYWDQGFAQDYGGDPSRAPTTTYTPTGPWGASTSEDSKALRSDRSLREG